MMKLYLNNNYQFNNNNNINIEKYSSAISLRKKIGI